MYINSIKTGNNHFQAFGNNFIKVEINENEKKVKFLEARLLNAKKLFDATSNNHYKNSAVLLIESQIQDLLLRIDYLRKSLKEKESSKKANNYMEMLLSSQDDKTQKISGLEKEVENIISDIYKNAKIDPYRQNIVINLSQLRANKLKSFEHTDKKLALDTYQQDATDKANLGQSVLVTAPTGTGKTLIAEHIIDKALKEGKRVIYTTPLKALCNDKYKQFSKLWGDYDENGNFIGKTKVGLATGDAKINPNAQLTVMTTEIYRNMLVQNGEKDVEKELKNVDTVIFDEFHYMGDNSRGSVWEEAIMLSPPDIKLLMLSATVSNSSKLTDWLNSINQVHKTQKVNVPEEERHVPLKHYAYVQIDNSFDMVDLLSEKINLKKLENKKLYKREKEVLSEIAKLYDSDNGLDVLKNNLRSIFDGNKTTKAKTFINMLVKNNVPYQKAEQYALILSDKDEQEINPELMKMKAMDEVPLTYLVRDLNRRKMLPALYFVYSKKNCKSLMLESMDKVGTLLTKDERNEIQRRIDKIERKGIYLGSDFEQDIKPCLLNGFAMHHAGMLPQCKSFIEELGRDKLIKICFATDTLGAGINFPFKTVIFSDFEKYTDSGFEEISANAFKQGAGRAGRRGIDDIGYVISIPKDRSEVEIPYNKVTQEADEIESAFKLSYGLILSPRFLNNSIKVLNNSFDCYQKKNYEDNLEISNSMKELLKERDFVEFKNGIYRLTKKGKIASKVRGMNEVLLAEILTNENITQNISPVELASLISIFAPDKNSQLNSANEFNSSTQKKLDEAISVAISVKEHEDKKGIGNDISINTKVQPFVKMWAASANDNTQDSKVLWTSIIEDVVGNDIVKTEGDFLKKINFTTDILKQIQKIAPSQYLKDTASAAIKMLQKSPVNDILLYELDYKENE